MKIADMRFLPTITTPTDRAWKVALSWLIPIVALIIFAKMGAPVPHPAHVHPLPFKVKP